MGPTPSSPLWQPCPFRTYTPETLRKEIRNIQDKSVQINSSRKLRIVMCGYVSGGKSSSINNILSALEGRYHQTAGTGGDIPDITNQYIEYKMLISDGHSTPYVICDTPGLKDLSSQQDMRTEVIKAAIMGKFQSGDKIHIDKVTVEDLGKMKPKQEMAVCVIFVLESWHGRFNTLQNKSAFESMKSILQFVQENDIKTACLLTKCDKLDPSVKQDVRNIYYSQLVEEARLTIKSMLNGFPGDRIFPIVNYTECLVSTPTMMVQTLFALKHIMGDIFSYLRKRVY